MSKRRRKRQKCLRKIKVEHFRVLCQGRNCEMLYIFRTNGRRIQFWLDILLKNHYQGKNPESIRTFLDFLAKK